MLTMIGNTEILEVTSAPTKSEAAKMLALVAYDTSLPQMWIDNFVDTLRINNADLIFLDLYGQILSSFVWSYDGDMLGCPRPLTLKALMFLRKFDELEHTHYADSVASVININQ